MRAKEPLHITQRCSVHNPSARFDFHFMRLSQPSVGGARSVCIIRNLYHVVMFGARASFYDLRNKLRQQTKKKKRRKKSSTARTVGKMNNISWANNSPPRPKT